MAVQIVERNKLEENHEAGGRRLAVVCRGYGSLKNRKDHLQARGAASRAELILLGTNGVCPQWREKEEERMKFYKIDDQIVISDKALTIGKELTANTVDAAFEKHVPVIEQNGDTVIVKVGSVEHPSMPEHYIEWILLETEM